MQNFDRVLKVNGNLIECDDEVLPVILPVILNTSPAGYASVTHNIKATKNNGSKSQCWLDCRKNKPEKAKEIKKSAIQLGQTLSSEKVRQQIKEEYDVEISPSAIEKWVRDVC